jgi:hypothetical protein
LALCRFIPIAGNARRQPQKEKNNGSEQTLHFVVAGSLCTGLYWVFQFDLSEIFNYLFFGHL